MENVKCMCCGSTAQVREEKIEYTETGVNIFYNCGCGTRFVKVYECVAEFRLSKKVKEKT